MFSSWRKCMFIGHLPAAYVLGCTAVYVLSQTKSDSRNILLAALVGGIIPDLDLIYFYTVGARQSVHHEYWSHTPYYWLLIYVGLSLIALLLRRFGAFKLLSVFFSAVVLHLLLDTITGQIQWLYPASTKPFTLVQVPAVNEWWVTNFLMHWTFAIELFVIVLSGILLFTRGRG